MESNPIDVGYIKLIKNGTSKGVVYYNWEIKAYCNTDTAQMEKLTADIENLNKILIDKYASEANGD